MKKFSAVLFTVLLLLNISGCSLSEFYKKADSKSTASQQDDFDDSNIIQTDYFTVEVPKRWNLDCENEIIRDDSGYSLAFYDKASKEADMGGWLFSINLFTPDIDYTYHPSYEILGSLKIDGVADYNIIATYPTDVCFSEETAAKYQKSLPEIPIVIESLAAKSGAILSEEPIPIEETDNFQ